MDTNAVAAPARIFTVTAPLRGIALPSATHLGDAAYVALAALLRVEGLSEAEYDALSIAHDLLEELAQAVQDEELVVAPS